MKTSSVNTRSNNQILPLILLWGSLMFCLNLLADSSFGQSAPRSTVPPISAEESISASIKVFVLRFKPGQDLRKEIESFVKRRGIRAGFIMTTVGSLEKTALRLADQSETSNFEGKFEIVSLVGTLSPDGVHLHISLSDKTGKTIGGHLVEGCRIYTTAEIVIGEAPGLLFTRETDQMTGYKELTIRPSKPLPKRKH